MNPILLKPNGDGTSQVVVNGRVWKTLPARELLRACRRAAAGSSLAAYEDLAGRFDVVVIEGAGSVSELNLRQRDLVNLGLVTRVAGAVDARRRHRTRRRVRVGPRHGHLLTPRGARAVSRVRDQQVPRRRVAVRRRRADPRNAHRVALLRRVSVRADIALDAEDSLALQTAQATAAPPGARHRHRPLSVPLERDRLPAADVGGLDHSPPADTHYDFVILPGSKNTIADLALAARRGPRRLDPRAAPARARPSSASAADYQMLGRTIRDPARRRVVTPARPRARAAAGDDDADARETDHERCARDHGRGRAFGGYEIHLGVTTHERRRRMTPFARLDDGTADGVCGDRRDRHLPARRAREPGGLRGGVRRPDAAVCARRPSSTSGSAAWFESMDAICDRVGARLTMEQIDSDELGTACCSDRTFDLRRAGRFLVAELARRTSRAQHVRASRRPGRRHVRFLVNHQSCEGAGHLDRHRVVTEARHRGLSRARRATRLGCRRTTPRSWARRPT